MAQPAKSKHALFKSVWATNTGSPKAQQVDSDLSAGPQYHAAGDAGLELRPLDRRDLQSKAKTNAANAVALRKPKEHPRKPFVLRKTFVFEGTPFLVVEAKPKKLHDLCGVPEQVHP